MPEKTMNSPLTFQNGVVFNILICCQSNTGKVLHIIIIDSHLLGINMDVFFNLLLTF